MNAHPLKELPGFAKAFAEALDLLGDEKRELILRVGEAVLPGIERIGHWHALPMLAATLENVAHYCAHRPGLRLVPPPRIAANDCEAP